jgi:hypothetical protein
MSASPTLLDAPVVDPRALRRMIEVDGGFTIRRSNGRHKVSGFSVALRPKRSLTFARDAWNDDDVRTWLANAELGRSWCSPFVGGWVDPSDDTVFLDVVVVVPGPLRRFACWLGRRTGQRYLFDLCHSEAVRLR